MKPSIDIVRKRRCFWRPLALLVMVLLAVLESVAHAESAPTSTSSGPKYGLDRMLSKAAPDLAQKMKDPKPASAGISASDMTLGYPNYTYRGPVAQAQARMQAAPPSAAAMNRALAAAAPTPKPYNGLVSNSLNPLALRQASLAPVAQAPAAPPAATPATSGPDVSSASALVAEAEAMELQWQQKQAAEAAKLQKRAVVVQAPEAALANSPASNRLLASLQALPSENTVRNEVRRQADSDQQYLAQQRALRGRVAGATELYPVAAKGDALDGNNISRAIRGGNGQQTSPVELQRYQLYVSDGYLNRHSAASQQNSPDEPGGVIHLGTDRAAAPITSTSKPFTNNAASRGGNSNSAGPSDAVADRLPYGE